MDETMLQRIASALGRIPSGLAVLTAGDEAGRTTGMLASWFQQASFEPPMITVAVNKKRFLNDWLKEGHPLVLNVLGENDGRFLKHFGKGFEPNADAFAGLNTIPSPVGVPVLADAPVWLQGEVQNRLETGDHFLYAVEVTAAGGVDDLTSVKPWVHLRKNGLNY